MEIILRVSAEGGSITLRGERNDQGWKFLRHLRDQTARPLAEPDTVHQSDSVDTWEEALKLMDRYPWPKLFPREVHPEFRALVLQEVLRRHELDPLEEFQLEEWRTVCRTPGSKFSEGNLELVGEVSAAKMKGLKKLAKSIEKSLDKPKH